MALCQMELQVEEIVPKYPGLRMVTADRWIFYTQNCRSFLGGE